MKKWNKLTMSDFDDSKNNKKPKPKNKIDVVRDSQDCHGNSGYGMVGEKRILRGFERQPRVQIQGFSRPGKFSISFSLFHLHSAARLSASHARKFTAGYWAEHSLWDSFHERTRTKPCFCPLHHRCLHQNYLPPRNYISVIHIVYAVS